MSFEILFLSAQSVTFVCTSSVNLALSKSASQSSDYANAYPVRAVDGNADGIWSSSSCTHTAQTTNPWWRGDLGSSQHVSEVFMVNRVDVGYRLFNIEIRVGKRKIPLISSHNFGLFTGPHSNQLATELPQSDKYYAK